MKEAKALAKKKTIQAVSLALAMFMCNGAFAIDNPDAPDYVAVFHEKSKKFEAAIEAGSGNGRTYAQAAHNYEEFLDRELNDAYRQLQSKLTGAQKSQLRESQKAWIQYRDKEIVFIDTNWTQQSFGSSSVVSRKAYRATIVRERVEQLLGYLQNY